MCDPQVKSSLPAMYCGFSKCCFCNIKQVAKQDLFQAPNKLPLKHDKCTVLGLMDHKCCKTDRKASNEISSNRMLISQFKYIFRV